MFTPKIWKMLGFRFQMMEYGGSTLFKKVPKTNMITLSGAYSYFNFVLYQSYVLCAIVNLIPAIILRYIFKDLLIDVPDDETNSSANHETPTEVFLAVDIAFLSILCTVACTQQLLRKWKHEFVGLFDSIVQTDELMEETFPRKHLAQHRYKRTVSETELLMLLVIWTGLLVPVLWVGFFLQHTEPLHRIFVEILEVQPRLDITFMPIILFLMWSVLQCSDAVILIIIVILLCNKFNYFWVTALQPIFKINDEIVLTQIGRISEENLFKIFRRFQVLNKMFNQIYANILMSSHYVCLKTLFVVTSYVSIRFFVMCLVTPGYQLFFTAVTVCILLANFETDLISGSTHASNTLRTKLRSIYKRSDVIFKEIGCTWDLKYEIVYPYLELEKGAFLKFLNSGVDMIVTLLVAA